MKLLRQSWNVSIVVAILASFPCIYKASAAQNGSDRTPVLQVPHPLRSHEEGECRVPEAIAGEATLP